MAHEEDDKEAEIPTLEGEALEVALSEMREHLRQGKSDAVAAYDMALTVPEFAALKRKLYEIESLKMRAMTAHDLFIDYRFAQQGVLNDLDTLQTRLIGSNQFGAAVSAIKAKSDVHDKIVKMGQDLGIFAKRVEERKVSVSFAEGMSVEDIRKTVALEVRKMSTIMKELGTGDMIDVDPGSLYRDAKEVVTPISTAGPAKRYTGRRVVKEPGPGA